MAGQVELIHPVPNILACMPFNQEMWFVNCSFYSYSVTGQWEVQP